MTDAPESPPLTATVAETANAFGTATTTIYAAVQRKEIPAIQIGRAIRIPRWYLRSVLDPK